MCSSILFMFIPNNHSYLHFTAMPCLFLKAFKVLLLYARTWKFALKWKLVRPKVFTEEWRSLGFSFSTDSGDTALRQKGLSWFPPCFEFQGKQSCNTEACAPQAWFGRQAVCYFWSIYVPFCSEHARGFSHCQNFSFVKLHRKLIQSMFKRLSIQSYEAAIDFTSPLDGKKREVIGCQANLKKWCLCYHKGQKIQFLKYPSEYGRSLRE